MGREECNLPSSAVILFLFFIVVSGSNTGYQQWARPVESIMSCFLAEYFRWRKLEQVVIFQNPTEGKIYFRYKSKTKFVPMSKRHAIEITLQSCQIIGHSNTGGFPQSVHILTCGMTASLQILTYHS
jgi:hypothetical protein